MTRKNADIVSNCIEPAARAAKAREKGSLQPDLAYTSQQAVPGPKGWVENNTTVRSKLKSKEQFPQG